MITPFEEIKVTAKKKAAEQLQREERLKQLEEAENHSGFRFTNPIQTLKNKKEIKNCEKKLLHTKKADVEIRYLSA